LGDSSCDSGEVQRSRKRHEGRVEIGESSRRRNRRGTFRYPLRILTKKRVESCHKRFNVDGLEEERKGHAEYEVVAELCGESSRERAWSVTA